ncbi:MAG: winged helix-turn-helix domain-containing protein [Gemmatimonadales bacterium]
MAKHGSAKHASESARASGRGRDGRTVRPLDVATSGEKTEPGALSLDRLIHERMRLGIVSALAVNDTLTFNDLKRLMRTTDGNLSVHARKLEDAAYVTCTKSFEGRMPKSEYRLTASGRRALERYLDHMEALIRTTRER